MSDPQQPHRPSWAAQPNSDPQYVPWGVPQPGEPQPTVPLTSQLSPLPKPPKKRAGRVLLILGVCLLGLIVIGALGSASKRTSATPSSMATADSTTSPSPTSSTTGAAAGIASWWTGGGQDHASAMQKDLTAIGNDGQNQDVAQMSTDCQSLSTDVGQRRVEPGHRPDQHDRQQPVAVRIEGPCPAWARAFSCI